MVDTAFATNFANSAANWADHKIVGDRRYNEGYKTGWKNATAEAQKMVSDLVQERDVAQADLKSNLYASREKGKVLSEQFGEEWYGRWQAAHHPVMDKMYQDDLKSKGYNID